MLLMVALYNLPFNILIFIYIYIYNLFVIVSIK